MTANLIECLEELGNFVVTGEWSLVTVNEE